MTTLETRKDATVEICSLEELQAEGLKVVSVEGQAILSCWNRATSTPWTTAVRTWGFPSTGAPLGTES